MPNIAAVLKDEIRRLAKKETKAATTKLQKDNAKLKRTAADLKRRVAKLERDNKQLVTDAEKRRRESVKTESPEVEKARISAKMIRSIRKRLKLSQEAFARLAGVTTQTVYMWEHKQGRLTFRGNSKTAIIELRKLKKREAAERLKGMKGKPKKKARKKTKKKAKKKTRKKAKKKARKKTKKKSAGKKRKKAKKKAKRKKKRR